MAFVDWLTGVLPIQAELSELNGGYVRALKQYGEIEYTTVRRMELPGSYDSVMYVRGTSRGIEFSGNPAKFLQGHNFWGPSPIPELGFWLGWEICTRLGIEATELELNSWGSGNVSLTRIDITRMVRPDGAPDGWANKWLSVASALAHGGHQRVTNRGQYDAGTLYVGQNSRRVSLKIYSKEAELKKHPIALPLSPAGVDLTSEYLRNTLRVEVTLRGMELRDRGLGLLEFWSEERAEAILDERIDKLSLPGSMSMTPSLPDDAPLTARQAYELWLAGADCRTLYSQKTFYRRRRELLAYGVDIAKVRPRILERPEQDAIDMPMKDALRGPGLDVPEWAWETPMDIVC